MLPEFNNFIKILFTILRNLSSDVNFVSNTIKKNPECLGELLQIIKNRFANFTHIPMCCDILQDLIFHIERKQIIPEQFAYYYLSTYCPEFKKEYPTYDKNRIYHFSIVEEKNTHTIKFGSVKTRGF